MILGIDTSCYTTSITALTTKGDLLADKRRLLEIPLGKRGLAQSEGFFQHVHQLPNLLADIGMDFDLRTIKAIGVSTRPRPVAGSYMPVFLAGQKLAESLSAVLCCPAFNFSHQEGHMMAGLKSAPNAEDLLGKDFLLCHFSGGTSEILTVHKGGSGYEFSIVAAGNDLHAGQFVDRIGVALGLPFPAGQHLEGIALSHNGEIPPIPTWVSEDQFSFSGPESAVQRLIKTGADPRAIARGVEHAIARTLEKVLYFTFEKTGLRTVLFVGGVMANVYLREYLKKQLNSENTGVKLYFADSHFASDNAFGIAHLALDAYREKNER